MQGMPQRRTTTNTSAASAGNPRIECSQTWAFSYDDGGAANAWSFVGIDTDSRLILT